MNSSLTCTFASPSGFLKIFTNSKTCSLWKLTTWFRSSFVAQKKKNLELEEMCLTVPLIQNVPYSCPYSIGLLIRTFSVLIKFRSFHKILVMPKRIKQLVSYAASLTMRIFVRGWKYRCASPCNFNSKLRDFQGNPKWYQKSKYLVPNCVRYESY